MMKYFSPDEAPGVERMITYEEFVKALRLPLEGRRLNIVKEAWCKIAGDLSVSQITWGQFKACYSEPEHLPRFADTFEIEDADESTVTMDMFRDLYADLSMATFND